MFNFADFPERRFLDMSWTCRAKWSHFSSNKDKELSRNTEKLRLLLSTICQEFRLIQEAGNVFRNT